MGPGTVGDRFRNTGRFGPEEGCLAFCDSKVARWSRAVFEYKDLWISRRSEQHKRLLGYIQVYDMQGLTWRHYSSREIADKLKTALQSGSFYVEAVSHMYVINASRLFSMVWKAPYPLAGKSCFGGPFEIFDTCEVVRNLISPWTASKISVSSGVPDDLIHSLGWACCQALLKYGLRGFAIYNHALLSSQEGLRRLQHGGSTSS